MADETETTTETPESPATEAVTEERTHPLAPGGVRFEEVVREKNEWKAQTADLRARLATLENPPRQEPAKAPTFYTAEQLQQAVDAGQITHAKMADQLAWQRAESMRQQVVTETQLNQKRASATAEITQYTDRVPALADSTSPEFLRAARAAAEIADDMGWDIRDPRVQRQALRQTFGSLDRLAASDKTREYDRQHADTAMETRGGGRGTPPKPDPFAVVPKPLMDEWKRLGYTPEQMKEELKYVDPVRWKRRHG